jgi:hypothetical protein
MISVDYNQMPMGQSLIPQNDGTFTTLINGVQVPVTNLPNALFSPDPYIRTTAQLNSPDPLVRAAAHIARQQQAEAALDRLRSPTSVPQTTVPTQQYTTVPVQVITNPLPDSPMINLKNLQPTVQLENLQRDQLIRQGLILAEASNRDRIGTRSQTQAQKEQSIPEANSIQFNRDNRYPSKGRDDRDRNRQSSKDSNRYPSKNRDNRRYDSKGRERRYDSKGRERRYDSKGRECRYNSKGREYGYNSKGREYSYDSKGHIREEEMIEEILKAEVIRKIETTTRAVVQVIMIQGQRGGALIGMTFALIFRSLKGIPQRITRGETARIRIPIEILEKILKVMIGEIRASLLPEIIIILIRIIEEGARIGRMILEMIDLDLER